MINAKEFLNKIKSRLGGEIDNEYGDKGASCGHTFGRLPRILTEYKGYCVKFDFIINSEFLMELNTNPPHRMVITNHTFFTKLLSGTSFYPGTKTEDSLFDSKYVVQYAKSDIIKKLLNNQGKELIEKLEPFLKFEMTNKEYKIIKNLDKIQDYTPDDALKDMDRLIEFHELCNKMT